MKRLLLLLIIILISPVLALELPVDITAKSAIVINTDNDLVVYTKNADEKMILASLTKIMTAYTAINKVENLNTIVEIKEEDLLGLEGFTCIGLEAGMIVNYRDLLYGLLLQSGADAAQALANHIAGNNENFVKLMNEEAALLDLRNSTFADTFGGSDNNISTARDIGILLEEALKNPEFNKIFKTKYYVLSNGLTATNFTRNLAIYHGLDEFAITGSKSGYTPEAGLLLASTSTVNDNEYIIVVMKSSENEKLTTHVLDTYRIINYIKKNNYENRKVLEHNKPLPTIKVKNSTIDTYLPTIKKDVYEFLNDEEFANISLDYNITKEIDNNFKKGDNLGYIDIKVKDEVIDTYNIYLEDDLFTSTKTPSSSLNILIVLLICIVVLFFINLLLNKN